MVSLLAKFLRDKSNLLRRLLRAGAGWAERGETSPPETVFHLGVLEEEGREPLFFSQPDRPALMRGVGEYLAGVWTERRPGEDLERTGGGVLVSGRLGALIGDPAAVVEAYCRETAVRFYESEMRMSEGGPSDRALPSDARPGVGRGDTREALLRKLGCGATGQTPLAHQRSARRGGGHTS
jgi:hypothetical protein